MERISTKTAQSVQDVIVLGFDNYSYILLNEQEGTGHYDFKEFNNSINAFNWLENNQKSTNLAIICSYEFLKSENFRFLKAISAHPTYKYIPFITVASDGMDMPVSNALKMGMDDCYTEPVNWSNLEKRVEFLHRFKKDLLADREEAAAEVSFKYHKTPFGKRLFDISVALVALTIASPILLLIALLIKLEDGGSVIYRSKRIGQGYQAFDFFKFRSMGINADKQRESISHLSLYDGDAFLKVKDDPRVTKIGKIIRRTSLDELPQLFNVLKGEMSIVGNRPLPLTEAETITKDKWAGRFIAPAGITGYWQVAPGGKENLTTEQRIGLDIEYAKKLSVKMDAKILLRTLPAMLQKGE